jgi:hypothetical protein
MMIGAIGETLNSSPTTRNVERRELAHENMKCRWRQLGISPRREPAVLTNALSMSDGRFGAGGNREHTSES